MSHLQAPASPIRLFVKAEETAILCALLREPPVMPGKHASYLELVNLAVREMPRDEAADLWLHQAVSVAATFVRSPALLGKIIERLLHASGAKIDALPAAYSSYSSSAIHAAVCAKNFEAVNVLLAAGHPLDQSQSRWPKPATAAASDKEIKGAMEMASTHLMECLQAGDSAGALQLLMIVEELSRKSSRDASAHASTSLVIVFDFIHGAVVDGSGSISSGESSEVFYRLLTALLRLGADPSARLADGVTPLHLAVKAHDWQCAAALVSFGADVNAVDGSGATPMDAAEGSLTRLHSMRAVLRFAEIDNSFLGHSY